MIMDFLVLLYHSKITAIRLFSLIVTPEQVVVFYILTKLTEISKCNVYTCMPLNLISDIYKQAFV